MNNNDSIYIPISIVIIGGKIDSGRLSRIDSFSYKSPWIHIKTEAVIGSVRKVGVQSRIGAINIELEVQGAIRHIQIVLPPTVRVDIKKSIIIGTVCDKSGIRIINQKHQDFSDTRSWERPLGTVHSFSLHRLHLTHQLGKPAFFAVFIDYIGMRRHGR